MKQNDSLLDGTQLAAVEALAGGTSITDAAKSAGISRSTLHRWMKDVPFEAALNGAKRHLLEEQECKLFSMASKAVIVLETALDEGDVKIAMEVAKGFGLLRGQRPSVGSPDADVLLKGRQASAEFASLFDDLMF